MSPAVQYHRQFGVYGICLREDQLLVIYKKRGPYTGRYDLPGGSVEPNESLTEAVHREFAEETGLTVQITGQIGTRDFIIPWTRPGFNHTHSHHIGTFYEVEYVAGRVEDSPQFDDSAGAAWVAIEELDSENSSPLVTAAVQWIQDKQFPVEASRYETWEIRTLESLLR